MVHYPFEILNFYSEAIIYSSIIAIVWGSLILSIDRYIVTSMTISQNWGRRLSSALPRILIAIVIGMTISKPLEIAIFADEIDKVIDDKRQVDINKTRQVYINKIDSNEKKYSVDIKSLEEAIKRQILIKNEIDSYITILRKDMNNEKKKREDEIAGIGVTGKKKRGKEAIYHEDEAEKISKYIEIEQNKSKDISTKISELETSFEKMINNSKTSMEVLKEEENQRIEEDTKKHSTSFISRLRIMYEIIEYDKVMMYADYFIMLLFILIEILPVYIKLISREGVYDNFINDESTFGKTISGNYFEIKEMKANSELLMKREFYTISDSVIKNLIPKWENDLNIFYTKEMEKEKNSFMTKFRETINNFFSTNNKKETIKTKSHSAFSTTIFVIVILMVLVGGQVVLFNLGLSLEKINWIAGILTIISIIIEFVRQHIIKSRRIGI